MKSEIGQKVSVFKLELWTKAQLQKFMKKVWVCICETNKQTTN